MTRVRLEIVPEVVMAAIATVLAITALVLWL